MKLRCRHLVILLAVASLLVATTGTVGAGDTCTMSDWSKWQAYFTPIVPHTAQNPGNPAGRPIPTKSPSFEELMAWVNGISSLPEPAMTAHAEEVARGDDHSTIVGHGPAKGEPASRNAWATGGVLRNDLNPGPFFETFDNFYGDTWRMLPHLWGGYAYIGSSMRRFSGPGSAPSQMKCIPGRGNKDCVQVCRDYKSEWCSSQLTTWLSPHYI